MCCADSSCALLQLVQAGKVKEDEVVAGSHRQG